MVSPETYQTADRKLIGSMMVFEAENLEAVRKAIEEDIYYTSRVVRPRTLVFVSRAYENRSGTRRTS